jgi:hypothetical protein
MPETSPDLNINEGFVMRDESAVGYEPRSLMLSTPSIVTKGGCLSLVLTYSLSNGSQSKPIFVVG